MLRLIYHPNVVKYAITLAGLLFVAFFLGICTRSASTAASSS